MFKLHLFKHHTATQRSGSICKQASNSNIHFLTMLSLEFSLNKTPADSSQRLQNLLTSHNFFGCIYIASLKLSTISYQVCFLIHLLSPVMK